jgi:hypothetical protein
VDIVAGWCSWSSGISPKVGSSDPSMTMDMVWVGGWPVDWFGVDLCLRPGIGCVVLVA